MLPNLEYLYLENNYFEGIIYPESHYGRDALVGIALFLTQLAESKMSAKQLRDTYPNYFISKNNRTIL